MWKQVLKFNKLIIIPIIYSSKKILQIFDAVRDFGLVQYGEKLWPKLWSVLPFHWVRGQDLCLWKSRELHDSQSQLWTSTWLVMSSSGWQCIKWMHQTSRKISVYFDFCTQGPTKYVPPMAHVSDMLCHLYLLTCSGGGCIQTEDQTIWFSVRMESWLKCSKSKVFSVY